MKFNHEIDFCVGKKQYRSQPLRAFADKTYRLIRWERGKPPQRVRAAHKRHVRCAAGPGHRRAIRRYWRKRERAFFAYRRKQLSDWCAPNPHPDGEGCWVIPASCVRAESGESWAAHNPTSPARGAYQLLGHGEPWPVDSREDALEHHAIAEGLYGDGGLGPWVAC